MSRSDPESIRVPDDTDHANAQRFVRAATGRCIWVDEMASWLCWTGKVWESNDHVPRRIAATISKDIAIEAAYTDAGDREAERLWSWSKKSAMAPRIEAMLQVARSIPGMAVGVNELDAKDHLLNVGNGILNLGTGQISPHDPQDLCSRIAGCDWPIDNDEWDRRLKDPKERRKRIDSGMLPKEQFPTIFADFLRDICKLRPGEADSIVNKNKADAIVGALSYCLSGGNPAHKVLLFLGSARNGKSTLLNCFSRLLGTYSGVMPPSVVASEDGQGADLNCLAALAGLRGLRFVSASELSGASKFNSAVIKRFSGGDEISCRFLHRGFFSYRASWTSCFATNELPALPPEDEALLARLKLFNFQRYYSDEGGTNKFGVDATPPDASLEHKLRAELSKILLLLVASGGEFRDVPAWSLQKNKLAGETQQLSRFLSSQTVSDDAELTPVALLYERYTEFCELNGWEPWSTRSIAKKMGGLGYTRARSKSTRYYRGIRMLPQEPDPTEAPQEHPSQGAQQFPAS